MKVYETQDQVFMGLPRPLGFVPGCTGTFNFYAMEKKYLYEAPQEEIDRLIEKGLTIGQLKEMFKQPSWCAEPDPLDPLGCWALTDFRHDGLRTKISEKYCKGCYSFKGQ